MKRSFPAFRVIAAAAALAAATAIAQPTADPAAPKKDVVKKDVPRKDVPKKPAAPKKAAPPKDTTSSKTAVSKNVTIYKNTPPPPIKGKDGKDIPTSPDAYDVSSAVPKKK